MTRTLQQSHRLVSGDWVNLLDGTTLGAPAPPAETGTLFGTSIGGQSLGPQIVRTYNGPPNIPTTWGSIAASNVTGVGAGTRKVVDGIRPGGTGGGALNWRNNATYISQLDQYLAAFPDVPDVRLTCWHEAEAGNNYGTTAAAVTAYVNDQAAFSTHVRAASASRTNPFIIVRIFMGYSFNHSALSAITDMCEGDFDELGGDIYNLDQPNAVASLAASVGVPWSTPELGQGTINSGATTTDAKVLSFMQSVVPLLRGVTEYACWFDSGTRNTLGDKPNSTAYWSDVMSGAA